MNLDILHKIINQKISSLDTDNPLIYLSTNRDKKTQISRPHVAEDLRKTLILP